MKEIYLQARRVVAGERTGGNCRRASSRGTSARRRAERSRMIRPRSVFVDPPYDRASLPLYGDLAAFASRVPMRGHLIVYALAHALPKVFGI